MKKICDKTQFRTDTVQDCSQRTHKLFFLVLFTFSAHRWTFQVKFVDPWYVYILRYVKLVFHAEILSTTPIKFNLSF
jgi:hypothetical protein